MGSTKSIVRGVRASSDFWQMCDSGAEILGISRNELIVSAVQWYCSDFLEKNGGYDIGDIITACGEEMICYKVVNGRSCFRRVQK